MIFWKRVSLPLLVLLGVSCAGNPPATDPTQNMTFFPEIISITGLEASGDGEVTDVVVQGNFPFNYSSYEPDPSRLVIEVPGAEASALESVISIDTDHVQEVHIETEEFPGGSRIARLEFTGLTSVRHDLFLEGNHLRVRFFGADPETATDESLVASWDDDLYGSDTDEYESDLDSFLDASFDEEGDGWDADSGDDDLPWLAALDEEDPAGDMVEADEVPVVEEEMHPVPVAPADALLNLRQDESDESLVVHLVADGGLTFTEFQLENPHRTVVDLAGVTNRVPFTAMEVESGFLRRVRVAQFQNQPERITRVVFDLNQPRAYRIEQHPDGLQVRFAPAGGFPVAAEAPGVQVAEAEFDASIPPLLAEVSPGFDDDESTRTDFEAEPFDADLDGMDPLLPMDDVMDEVMEDAEAMTDLDRAGDVVAPMTDEDSEPLFDLNENSSTIDAPVEPPVAAADEPLEEAVAAKFNPADLVPEGTLILKAARDPFSAQAISPTENLYSGPRISLDFKDADIKDVFRLFHEILGYNIVLDPGVSGKLTIVLNDVPADQALDIILKNNSFDKVFENNVIRVATTQKLAQEAAARRQLQDAKELEQEPITFARKLSYAKAKDVVTLLRKSGGSSTTGGLISRKGTVRHDLRTNTVIISDIPKNIAPINRLLDLLDEETPQVMIEARIVETDRNFERDFGISWGFDVDLDPALGTETNMRFPHRVNVDYDVNLPAPVSSSTLGLSFGNIRDSIDLFFKLEAFELNGDAKILSSPRIATQNNETAIIEQGVQIPVVNTTATEINVEFISASLRLEVTPQITKDNTIIMEVMVDNSSPDFVNRVGDVPPIITERAETLILVENGGTAVIGGIYKLNKSFTEVGVPGLKRIPILGWLFKNRAVVRGNTELLIFLTPRILERN